MLCSRCFDNPGVIALAERLGRRAAAGVCSNCSLADGAQLDVKQQEEVFTAFFESSRGAIYFPPNLRAREAGYSIRSIEHEIEFDRTALHDYRLLTKETGLVLDWYGPPTYLVGATTCIDELWKSLGREDHWCDQPPTSDPERTRELFEGLLRYWPTEEIAQGTFIYRARRDAQDLLDPGQFDSPPTEANLGPSRFNGGGTPLLYASFDVNACLLEIRTTPDDIAHTRISLAVLQPTQNLRVLNLCADKQLKHHAPADDGTEVFNSLDAYYTMMALTDPGDHNYPVSQAMAQHIHDIGFDGFIHDSAMRCVTGRMSDSNLVLFGRPISDGKLNLVSSHPIKIRNVQYRYDLGFAWRERHSS